MIFCFFFLNLGFRVFFSLCVTRKLWMKSDGDVSIRLEGPKLLNILAVAIRVNTQRSTPVLLFYTAIDACSSRAGFISSLFVYRFSQDFHRCFSFKF